MRISISPGIYVVAVSGGVDSMVLLDLLRSQPDIKLIVAHFDHGIRPDSELDRHLVQDVSRTYRLGFVFDKANLGPNASEDKARQARYKFLKKIQKISQADAIITAHHQDDLIETAMINILRGTHRKGLSSLNSRKIIRPLLDYNKKQILGYAKKAKLKWREDSTNSDQAYLRNRLRHQIIPKLSHKKKQELIQTLTNAHDLNREIDDQIAKVLQLVSVGKQLDKTAFCSLSHQLACEIMATWLRKNKITAFDRKLIEKLVILSKTLRADKSTDINSQYILVVGKSSLKIESRANS